MMQNAIELFTLVVKEAMPYAVVFALGNKVVTIFMRMAFGGKVEL